jgi:hypothetical protein
LLDTLKANTIRATNTITHPDRIVPVCSKLAVKGERLEHVLPWRIRFRFWKSI